MQIVVKKGLNIPMAGKPSGAVQELPKARQVALDLTTFNELRFRVLVKEGERVAIGQPLVENKAFPGQMFVSPAGGVVTAVRRGLKRQLHDIVIDVDPSEAYYEHGALKSSASREEIVDLFMRGGLFPHIRLRPFDLVPNPQIVPRDIFVTAWETRPYLPAYEMQVAGHESYFQAGLTTLSKLTTGKVHLVYSAQTSFKPFLEAQNVEKHTASGPHPAGSSSVHIQQIAPIKRPDDYVWSLTALDVIIIGKMALEGRYHTDRIIAIAGEGVVDEKRGYFRAKMGCSITELMAGRLANQSLYLIAGDPLTGSKVEGDGFLRPVDTAFSVIPENSKRQPFHFLRLGLNKYSATRTYLSGHIKPPAGGFSFTTNQHGEERAFIDPNVYDRVMPLHIPTVFLVKAVLAEDYELADQLGLLEVVPSDFALPTFICPSKIEMVEIIRTGLRRYAQEMGH